MKEYTQDEIEKILDNMETYGGNFVKALADLYFRADYNNKRILQNAFKEHFEEYLNLGK